MAKDTLVRHTWDGAEAGDAPEYKAQMAMDVHLVGPEYRSFEVMNPLTGQPDKVGEERLVHTTKCGIILGTVYLRSTDDASEVTCAKCA